ncbi:MAG: SPFH/Band 7/PHB domain protein [Chloroflexi bacterium]|nr:SPFH/Band 7/PHB domain protein [Chloroflexota bacterium]
MEIWLVVIICILSIIILFTLIKSITTVRQAEKGIVERFGRYKETLDPGLRFLLPFVDRVAARIDMRETVLDIEPQAVITKDNVGVTVDAVVYYYVTDAKAVRYEVANFYIAISKLAQTNLRNLVGDMSLDETLASRERINASLRTTLDEATDKWGVKVTRVEVKEILPPKDITDAMSKQMKAEREKRATILDAEAYRQKQILQAEGDKENTILVAQGYRQAAILRAEGEAKAIETVSTAASTYFVGNAQLLKQLEVTQASLQDNTKLVISDQSRLINVLGLSEALDSTRTKKPKT